MMNLRGMEGGKRGREKKGEYLSSSQNLGGRDRGKGGGGSEGGETK